MKKILIIDDSELVSKLLKEALTEAGYETASAADANQGYETALEFLPDLILLDVQLPDVMGFDLLRVLRNRHELNHVPIIMITGSHQDIQHKLKGFQGGADDYVLKPFEMPVLLERIRVLLRWTPQPAVSAEPEVPEASLEPAGEPATVAPALTTMQTLLCVLLDPFAFPEKMALPPFALSFIGAMLILILCGLGLTSGTALKPAMALLAAGSFWVALISALVVSSSLMGVPLPWKEGARLLALACVPMLLKYLGGLVISACTTLAPYYFTASPALFMTTPSFGAARFDLFEIWSVVLLWLLLRKKTETSAKTAGIITGIVWFVGVGLAAGLSRLGTGG
jgi:CheY-like chemotaxis protein